MDTVDKILSKIEFSYKDAQAEMKVMLEGMGEVLFEEVIEPKLKELVGRTDTPLDDSIEALVTPILKKEGLEELAKLESKLQAKLDQIFGVKRA